MSQEIIDRGDNTALRYLLGLLLYCGGSREKRRALVCGAVICTYMYIYISPVAAKCGTYMYLAPSIMRSVTVQDLRLYFLLIYIYIYPEALICGSLQSVGSYVLMHFFFLQIFS